MRESMARLVVRWPALQFLTNNLSWIIISVILSLIIWVVATLENNPIQQRQFSEAITIKFIDDTGDGVVLLNTTTLNRTARIVLRAPRSSWESEDENRRFSRDDIEIYADLRELPVGVHTVELEGRILDGAPPGRAVSISPPEITVELVPLETLRLPLAVSVFSNLPANYEYVRGTCNYDQVTISGPGAVLDEVARVAVYLNVSRPNEPLEHSGPVILFRTDNREFSSRDSEGLRIEPSTVTCEVVVQEIINSKTLNVEPVIVGSPPDGYLIGERTLSPETIVVVGDPDVLDTLNEFVQTEPIDLSTQTSSFSRTVQVILPDGIQLRSDTTLITVAIEIIPIPTTRQFAEVPVQIINLDPSLIANIVPQSVIVTVEGPEPLVRELMIEDLLVTVNLQGQGPGTHNDLPASVNILKESVRGVATVTVRPATVDVVIAVLPTPTIPATPTQQPPFGIIGKQSYSKGISGY